MRRATGVRLHYTNSEAGHGEITQHEEQGTALERRAFEQVTQQERSRPQRPERELAKRGIAERPRRKRPRT